MGDPKEKLLKNLNVLQELVIERDRYIKKKDDLSRELNSLKPKGHHFISIFEFIKKNIILKIIFSIFSILFLILILALYHPLGYNVPMIIYVPLSIIISFIVIVIYKKCDSILKSILSLVGILIITNIFKILPIDYYINSLFACIVAMTISLIICLPICLIWYFVKFSKFMSTKNEIISKNKEIYEQRKNELEESINEVDIETQKCIEKINKLIKKDLHYNYCTKNAVERFINYLEFYRCDNLKECINLYEKEIAQEKEQNKLYELKLAKQKALEKELAEKQRERKEREQREKENSESFKKIAETMGNVQNYIDEEKRRRKY